MAMKSPRKKGSPKAKLNGESRMAKRPARNLQGVENTRDLCEPIESEKIIQTVHHPLLVLNKDLIVIRANPAFYKIFRLRPDEVVGFLFHCARGPTERAGKLRSSLREVIQKRTWFEDFEFETRLPNGGHQFLLLNAQPLFRSGNVDPLILLSLNDITERREAEEVRENLVAELGKLAHELEERVDARTRELQKANAKLQTLSARLLEAQEMERRHLARELHDEIGQQITCLQIMVEQQFADAAPSLKRGMKEIKSAIAELLQTVRQLSLDLRPLLLDDFGVLAALEWHFKRFRKRTGIEITLDKKFFREDMLNSFLKNVLFRVAQESLTNVARHAHTNKVRVQLDTRKGVCRLEVRDNGQGFDVKEALQKKSSGLAGMQERVFLAGGSLTFDSAPGKGTTIALELPLISPQMNVFDRDYSAEPS